MNQCFCWAAAIGLLATSLTAQDDTRPVTEYVWTQKGAIRGQTNGEVDQFLGVPYAASPVGDLRWKAPVPPPRWYGVRDATKPASECMQLATGPDGKPAAAGSEDCLYLNIYRPARGKARGLLPVLVFMHGGSNIKGSANDYDPSEMVAQTGIMVVTVEYRLNVFGFLALPSLDAEVGDTSSGNYGLLDQQAALHWVHENILGFGGNPSNVTIQGESAGAVDVCGHLVSPLSAGLFHHAILESGYCPTASHGEAIDTSALVATALGCTDQASAAACLRAKPAADVLKAVPLSRVPGGGTIAPGQDKSFNASPNFGNGVLPMKPADALASAQWNWSPILVGSNHDEAALWLAPALIAARVKLPLSVDAYEKIVGVRYGSFAPSVLGEYDLHQYRDPFFAYADQVTDYSPLGCQVSTLSASFASLAQTFRFEFDDQDAAFPGSGGAGNPGQPSLGAFHGSELQYLFKMTQLAGPQTAAQQQLSTRMIQYWANFVRTGNPNGPGLATWPRYDAGARQVLSLRPGGDVVIDNFDTDHHCAFWAAAPGPRFQR